MPEFVAKIIAGTVIAAFMASIFAFLSGYGTKGFGTALIIVFVFAVLSGEGYIAFGVVFAIMLIVAALMAKAYFQKE